MNNPTPTPEPPAPQKPLTPEEDIAKNKDLAALSYLWILSLVVYWSRKDSPFARFHARQGVTLFVVSLLCLVVPVVSRLLMLLVLIASAFGFMNAAQGKWTNLPLVAALSRFDWKQLRADWQSIVAFLGKFWHSVMSHVPKTAPHETKPTPSNPPATPPTPTPPSTPA